MGGDRVSGQPEDGHAVEHPEGQRLGRADGDLPPVHLGDAAEHHLDDVVVAHRHPAAGHHGVAGGGGLLEALGDDRLVVDADAEVDDLAAGLGHQRHEHRPVGVADLADRERLAGRDELVAGRHHRHPGPADDVDGGLTQAGHHPEVGGAEDAAGRKGRVAHGQVAPGQADVVAGPGLPADDDDPPVRLVGRVLHHDDGVGAVGGGGAGHDPDGLARPDGDGRRLPRRQLVDHPEADGRLRRGPGGVGRPDGIAVDPGVGEGRDGLGGRQVLDRHQAEGVGQRHRRHRQPGDGGENAVLGLFQGNHGLRRY